MIQTNTTLMQGKRRIGGWNIYKKRQRFIFTRTIGGWNMYEKTVTGRHFNKIRRNES